MSRFYTLNEAGEPTECPDVTTWGRWMQTANRTVDKTTVGPYLVSTVFLGLDHSFNDHGPPLIYETMTFDRDGDETGITSRATTRADALACHEQAVKNARARWPDRELSNGN